MKQDLFLRKKSKTENASCVTSVDVLCWLLYLSILASHLFIVQYFMGSLAEFKKPIRINILMILLIVYLHFPVVTVRKTIEL